MKIAYAHVPQKRAFTRRDTTFEPGVSKDCISGSTKGRLSFAVHGLRNLIINQVTKRS